MTLGQRATRTKDRTSEPAPNATKKPLQPATLEAVAAVESGLLTHRSAADLQRLGGNRALRTVVQPKLTVGRAGDRHEQEADRTAKQVKRNLQSQPEEEELMAPRLQRQPEEQEELLQPETAAPVLGMEGGPLDAATGDAVRRARGGGKALDTKLRRSMEGSFGADFSGVRVHDDSGAHQANRKIQAKAFTSGSDVFLRKGEYNPAISRGQELLAHELTHVVQQGAAVHRAVTDGVIQRLSVADYREAIGDRKGNFNIGTTSATQANKIGADWIGKKLTGKISLSNDKLHQYRKPVFKPKQKEKQANVEARAVAKGPWTTNAHISIAKQEEK